MYAINNIDKDPSTVKDYATTKSHSVEASWGRTAKMVNPVGLAIFGNFYMVDTPWDMGPVP